MRRSTVITTKNKILFLTQALVRFVKYLVADNTFSSKLRSYRIGLEFSSALAYILVATLFLLSHLSLFHLHLRCQ